MSTSVVNPDIFKAYDIRGVYPKDIDADTAEKIGKAFAQLLLNESDSGELTVVVSRDMRVSSVELRDAVVAGIIKMGVNVADIGLASTPTFYFAVGYYGYNGGIQVSASHNPAEYNGCKLVRAKAVPISGDSGIYEIRDMALANEFTEATNLGSVTEKSGVLEELVKVQTKDVGLNKIKPFKVVADAANAMGALDLDELSKVLPISLERVNFELDGSFPSHEADPLKDENLVLLKEEVLNHKADFGISPDGDGDRIFIVMENGMTLPADILRGILAQVVLEKNPGAKIGYDIRPGKATVDMIEEAGGIPFITKVGHSLIKEHMITEDAAFAGESSGHFYFKFPFGSFDAPVKALVDFMAWLTEKDMPLSEAVKPWQKYYHSGEINSIVKSKEEVFAKIKDTYFDAKRISELDGVLIEYDDFWFNVRGSNTEPKMRLNLEAVDKETMEQKRDEVLELIRG